MELEFVDSKLAIEHILHRITLMCNIYSFMIVVIHFLADKSPWGKLVPITRRILLFPSLISNHGIRFCPFSFFMAKPYDKTKVCRGRYPGIVLF